MGEVIVEWNVDKLNKDIEKFENVTKITKEMKISREGISRMVMLDRYSYKDTEKETIGAGDLVICTVKEDPNYPQRGVGIVQKLEKGNAYILIEEEYRGNIEEPKQKESGIIKRKVDSIDKPMEVYYEQISKRVAKGLSEVEVDNKEDYVNKFSEKLQAEEIVPAGRVLYGAGSGEEVTYFNCFVMPFPKDSREGLSEHRSEAMEIMSRGGGVGTNGSTLRPRDTLARGVNGKSSGSVSWLEDLSTLTHLIQQGGSRRGAQMLMLADWHPDIVEFIISKMQNPDILRFIIKNTEDEQIKQSAMDKLKFTPLTEDERKQYELIKSFEDTPGNVGFTETNIKEAKRKLDDGGTYSVNSPDYLSGANISVAITDDFMETIKQDGEWELRFPDTDIYSEEQMEDYNTTWHEIGDVREWENRGYPVRTHRTIKAKELWQLINICATYAAEPGIFFIDRANKDTNAQAYGQKVVATNPCFTGDMELLTTDGYKTFEELEKIGHADIVNKNGKIVRGKVWKSGNKPTVQVRLSDKSTIRSTEDHVYMTNLGGEVEAKDLKGKKLMPYLKRPEISNTEYQALGFIQGDGTLTDLNNESKKGITVNLGKDDSDVKRLFSENCLDGEYPEGRHWYIKGLNEKIRELGFSIETLTEREFPETYNNWAIEEKTAFIRGMYSANGCVISSGRITYKTTSLGLAKKLMDTLELDFGIDSYMTTNKEKEVEFSNGVYTCKESYDINIGRYRERVKFYNTIGFIHEYKNKRLHDNLLEKSLTVMSVKETNKLEDVYDFNEPETNWGVVEGFVVHNCGEQPLAGYSVCNLAAINLANMANKETKEVNFNKLEDAVRTAIRMQDNIIDATPYFLEDNKNQALGERRIGLGVMGLADLLIYTENRYGSKEGNEVIDKVFEKIAITAYEESIELAKSKGSFPFLVGDTKEETKELRNKFSETGYMKRMPKHIRQGVIEHGIRNSHLLTVAP